MAKSEMEHRYKSHNNNKAQFEGNPYTTANSTAMSGQLYFIMLSVGTTNISSHFVQ